MLMLLFMCIMILSYILYSNIIIIILDKKLFVFYLLNLMERMCMYVLVFGSYVFAPLFEMSVKF